MTIKAAIVFPMTKVVSLFQFMTSKLVIIPFQVLVVLSKTF